MLPILACTLVGNEDSGSTCGAAMKEPLDFEHTNQTIILDSRNK